MSRMNYDDLVIIGALMMTCVVGILVGAVVTARGHGPCVPLPTSVPVGLVEAGRDWALSPTGGYIRIDYRPKEEMK